MRHTIGISALCVKAHLPFILQHAHKMQKNSRTILAENLAKLMMLDDPERKIAQKDMGKMAGCNQRTIGRILSKDMGATVDTLDGIAKAFGLHTWQLMTPDLDPSNPPINHMTESEKKLYERMRESARQIMDAEPSRYKAHQ